MCDDDAYIIIIIITTKNTDAVKNTKHGLSMQMRISVLISFNCVFYSYDFRYCLSGMGLPIEVVVNSYDYVVPI